jgi:YgiT-type zinc finger domain-containing protein
MKICPTCHLGRLAKRSMAYIEWHGGNLLVVDRMPVQVCDVCGDQNYDDNAIEELHRLLWSRASQMISSRSSLPGRHSPR